MRGRVSAETKVRWLLRWYPREWKDRYAEEFAALLLDDIEEQPRSRRRTLDTMRSGLVARLSLVALCRGPVRRTDRSMVVIAWLVVGVCAAGVSLATQLASGTRQVSDAGRPAAIGSAVLPLLLVTVAALLAAAVAPIVPAAVRAVRDGRARMVGTFVTVIGVGVVVLSVGGHHFAMRHQPAGSLTAYGWAETLAISTYWVHPTRLLAQPGQMLAWMVVSPLAVAAIVSAATRLCRALPLSAAVVRYETTLARIGVLVLMAATYVGSLWVVASRDAWRLELRAGSLDQVMIVAMTLAVVAIWSALRNLTRGVGGPVVAG